MNRQTSAYRLFKRILYLSGLLAEEPSEVYPKKISDIGVRTERVIVEKKLYLDSVLTIKMLAKEIGTNRTYLSKFFKEEKECSFKDYINFFIAEYAKTLLFSPKKQAMADIAIMSGFGSVRAMNRSFIKNFGNLPARLRKEYLLGISTSKGPSDSLLRTSGRQ